MNKIKGLRQQAFVVGDYKTKEALVPNFDRLVASHCAGDDTRGHLAKPRHFIPNWISSASSGIKAMRKHPELGQLGSMGVFMRQYIVGVRDRNGLTRVLS